jgi:hypothetical protein
LFEFVVTPPSLRVSAKFERSILYTPNPRATSPPREGQKRALASRAGPKKEQFTGRTDPVHVFSITTSTRSGP